MADRTAIGWTHRPGTIGSTWNPWRGCRKISAGCKNCYMFREQKRYGNDPGVIVRSKTTFNDPQKWKEPHTIFTCSWSDWFIEEADEWREDAWDIIRRTPQHTYLILTKRIERVLNHLPADWGNGWPNVWLGATTENQATADERIPILLDIPAKVRFLSCEPLLGPVELFNVTAWKDAARWWGKKLDIHLVISGGESGTDARRHLTEWEIHLRDQCHFSGIPFFFKQHGDNSDEGDPVLHHGGDWLWGKQYHEFPEVQHGIS